MPTQPPRAKPRRRPKTAAKAPEPLLDQRQLDLLGLALIAAGVLVAIPLYGGAGGVLGDGVAGAARLVLGAFAVAAPVLLIGAGVLVVSPAGPRIATRVVAGAVSATGAITLVARATEGPGGGVLWSSEHLRGAGGVVGEALWGLTHAAFGGVGPYVIAVALLLAAALLLTGAHVSSVAAGVGRGLRRAYAVPAGRLADRRAARRMALADRSQAVARSMTPVHDPDQDDPGSAVRTAGAAPTGAGGRRKRPAGAPGTDAPRTWASAPSGSPVSPSAAPVAPPELPGVVPVVRRTARPQLVDGAERFPDLFGHDGPVWIGPFEDEATAGVADAAPAAPAAPYPDPLAEFDAALAASETDDAGAAVDADDDLPLERDGRFAEEDLLVARAELDEELAAAEHAADIDDDPVDDDDAAADRPGVGPQALTPMGRYRAETTEAPDFPWKIPPRRYLTKSPVERGGPSRADQQQTSALLLEALGHFGVQAELVGCVAGPHITRYELRLAPGVKMNKVANLKDDLAYALAAVDIRILAPIPGKTAVGVEVPNRNRAMVRLGDVFADAPPKSSPLTVWLGKDVEGQSIFADLAKMPHLLVAGTTGAGKSGCINAMLSSVLLSATPHDVRLVLVDPKQVELTPYESVPHLLTPVITNPKMAATALQNLVREMEARYSTMSLSRTRSLPELNRVRRERGEQEFPYILCVIDELADLMMVAPGEVEDSIIRLAQKARAVGIHLVLATQTPRVDVITGMIKANVPSRIAFAVSSQTDSRVILDQNGAESLLGQGDMLFAPVGSARLQRIQGAYIDEPQIEQITDYWRRQGEPDFREELLEAVEDEPAEDEGSGDGLDPDEDPMLAEAIKLVVEMGTASTSMMQRRLRVGYTRAGRLIDMLERRGVISGYEGSKARQVLIGPGEVERVLRQVRAAAGDGPEATLFDDADAADHDDDTSGAGAAGAAAGPTPGAAGQ